MNILPIYQLHSITRLKNNIFSVELKNGDDFVNGNCEIEELTKLGCNIIRFCPDEFNRLCTMGQFDSRAIGNLVSSFYKSFTFFEYGLKINTLPFYKLCSITYLEKEKFALVLTDGENFVNGCCEVQEIKSESLGRIINLAQFHPEEFRKLCTMGQVDSKAIGNLVLSFYKSFYSSELKS